MPLINIFELFLNADVTFILMCSFSFCGVILIIQMLVFGRAKL